MVVKFIFIYLQKYGIRIQYFTLMNVTSAFFCQKRNTLHVRSTAGQTPMVCSWYFVCRRLMGVSYDDK